MANEGADKFIMIATDVGHMRTVLRPLEQQVHDLVMERIPIPAFAQCPTIHNIADQIRVFSVIVLEKIEE
jgi:hypothetical protein